MSLVTLIDQPGQSNYAATNTFLECFCQYRHKMGLLASVTDVCPVDDIGLVSKNPFIRRKLKSQGLCFLAEREMLDYMQLAFLNRIADDTNLLKDQSSIDMLVNEAGCRLFRFMKLSWKLWNPDHLESWARLPPLV